MARFTFRLPDIGECIAEAEIVAWHVKVGAIGAEDAPLCDMMTDKATVEMTAPVSGKVVAVAGDVGDQIAIGSILAVFETEGEAEAIEAVVEVAPNEAAQVVKPEPTPSPVVADEGRSSRAKSRDVARRVSTSLDTNGLILKAVGMRKRERSAVTTD